MLNGNNCLEGGQSRHCRPDLIDAGLALKAGARTAIELGARYSRTSGLEFDGRQGSVAGGGTARTYSPDLKNFAVMVGVRQSF